MSNIQFASSVVIVAWIGWAILCASLGIALYATNLLGKHLFRRIRRVYHIAVIGYWLDRLEREGTHVFKKASEGANNAE